MTAGTGITSTTGNIAASAGQVNANTSMSAGTTMTAGTGITATTGNISASAGQVNANTTMTAGSGITSTTGNIVATAGQINAGTTITAGTGITATLGNVTVSSGNVAITAGNLTIPNTTSAIAGNIQIGGSRWISNYGTLNTFVGQASGNVTLTTASATQNSGYGYDSLMSLTTGGSNSAFGSQSLNVCSSGIDNSALGVNSLLYLTTGGYNLALGYSAGISYTGAESSNILLMSAGVLSESNVIRIGTPGSGSSQQNKCFIAGITGVTPGATAQLSLTDSNGQLGTLGAATNGQIPIGSTGANPVLAAISAGTGISVTNAAGAITIASTSGTAWSVITSSQNAVINNGYICNAAGTVTVTLPTTAAAGTQLAIAGMNNATGWKLAQNASQHIFFGATSTTVGTGGFLASTAIYDSVNLVCNVANTSWIVISSIGNITVN
jgi:hypothetical protein